MPENFDSMLAAMADAAVSGTDSPSAAEVRQRGHQRTVRRRMAASAATLTAACCAVVGAMATGVLGGSAPETTVVPAASISAPALLPSPQGSVLGAAPTPGIWARTDGVAGYLIIYPQSLTSSAGLPSSTNPVASSGSAGSAGSAIIAISQSGSLPLCVARISPAASDGAYPVSASTCGGLFAADMTVALSGSGGDKLVLRVPASSGQLETDIPFAFQPVSTSAVNAAAGLALKPGTWVSNSTRITVTVKDTISWSMPSASGQQTGIGTVVGNFDGGVVVFNPCENGKGWCGALQLSLDAKDDTLTVIGSNGPVVFIRAK